jgi:ATP-dependent Clp protease ATP-binding subunit ClpC
MADHFDKFTEQAKRVLIRSQQEAQRLHHTHIGTEHLLLGLVGEEAGGAAQVLAHLGVEPQRVRRAVEGGLERGERPVGGDVRLTPGAKRVIELTVEEARRLGHDHIGTEHLLLGLIREEQGRAAGVLGGLGVAVERVRHEVLRLTGGGRPPRPAEPAV